MKIPLVVPRTTMLLLAAGWLASGCLPYTVGSTARPAPAKVLQRTLLVYAIPGAIESEYDSVSVPLMGADFELRYGIDERSDIGLRFPSLSGAVLSYKRRMTGDSGNVGAALAVMAGGGFVNFGDHGMLELSLLASSAELETWTAYGGLRTMYVVPLSRYAVSDRPTAGAFIGVRLGSSDLGVSPEVGVYYDPSALELRERRVIIVPGVSVHGSGLLDAFQRIFPGRPRAPARGTSR